MGRIKVNLTVDAEVAEEARALARASLCGFEPVDLALDKAGIAALLRDAQGRVILPSVVRYLPGQGRQIGWDAQANAAQDPANTIASVKRFMGRGLKDVAHPEKLPYQFVDQQTGMLSIQTVQGPKSPVEVSAEILATLRYQAEDSFNDDLYGAVITVPAYFDDAQRQATKDAAQLAGLNVLRLINEPTAAAIAYGLDKGSEGVYAVYDLGGGTFDISIIEIADVDGEKQFEVLSTNGDTFLGGEDFDQRIIDYIIGEFKKEQGVDLSKDVLALQRLKEAAEKAKIELSNSSQTDVNLPYITADASGPKHLNIKLTRAKLESLVDELIERTIEPCRVAIKDADLLDEAQVEHQTLKDLITQIQSSGVGDELFDAKVRVLGEYMDHHVKEERTEMFAKARAARKLDLMALRDQLEDRKELLMSEMAEMGDMSA